MKSTNTQRKTILYLGNKLSNHGFTPTSVETLGERLKSDFKVIQYSSVRNPVLRLLHFWWAILRWGKKVDYVLIDTYSSAAFHYAWTSGILAKLLGAKYIPILHGGNLPERFKSSRILSKVFLQNAWEVVSPSGFLKEVVNKRFQIPVQLIPNYIDIVNYPYREKKVDQIKLLWVRSFHEIYNPQLAVRVLKGLVDAGHEDTQLCMVGPDKDGSMMRTKELADELGVSDKLKITGRLSKPEWIKLSEEYNIFINTTDIDNTPVSLMEAMALGFLVITTKVGGIPYLFENGKEGIMVKKDNAEAMVKAINELKHRPEFYSIFQKYARRKAEFWDWELINKNWIKLLA